MLELDTSGDLKGIALEGRSVPNSLQYFMPTLTFRVGNIKVDGKPRALTRFKCADGRE